MEEQDNNIGSNNTPDQQARYEEANDALAKALGVKDDAELLADIGVEPEPEPEPEPEQQAAPEEEPAKDENKPSEERYKESLDSLWAEARRRTRDAKRQLQELEGERAQLEAQRQSLAEQQRLAELMRKDPREAFAAFTRQAGLDPNDFYQELTESHLGQGGETPKAIQRQIEQLRQEQQQWRQKQEEAARQSQAQQREMFLRNRVTELSSVQTHDALKKQFPYLASIPENKFQEEITNSVLWAADHKPELLNDPIEFARMLDDAAKAEYSTWQQRYASLTQATPEPAQSGSPSDGRKSSKPVKNTLTNTDSASSGVTRPLTEQERLAKAGDMLADVLIPSFD